MANPSYEEKSLVEDEGKVTGLVDYSSSSEDEDPTPLLKKQRLGDSGSDEDGFSNYDADEEYKMELLRQSPTVSDDTFYDDDCVVYCFSSYRTDHALLNWGPYSYRTADTWNGREVYCISVDGETPRKESKCLELLDAIACGERFLGCSVEMDSVFFANLSKDEAARMQGFEEVLQVVQRQLCFIDA